jgi:IclR family KDG regulon transcriptional repressor
MARTINTLKKALAILEEIVANQHSGLTLTEIVERAQTPKSSTHRILSNLLDFGYLSLETETGKYRGNLKLSSLGSEVLAQFDLRVHMRPHLIRLHQQTGHTVNLAIRTGSVGVYIDRIESQRYGIRLFSNVGQTFPLHSSGLGKALLAYAEPEELERIVLRPLKAYTPQTITDPDRLRNELALIRKRGYAMDRDETFRGVMCIAATILGSGQQCVGAVSVPFPTFAEEERDLNQDIEAVKQCAQAGSAYHPRSPGSEVTASGADPEDAVIKHRRGG